MTKLIESREKQAKALALRKMGASLEEIARVVGWNSHQAASKAIKAAMDRLTREPAEDLRHLESLRLDDMLKAIASHVNNGNLTAIDRALKIMERRARLWGLDSPVQHDITSGGEKIKAYIGISPEDWDKEDGTGQK